MKAAGELIWSSTGKTWWGEACMEVGYPLPGSWQLEGKFVIRDGRAVMVEMHIYPALPRVEPDDGVTTLESFGIEDLYCDRDEGVVQAVQAVGDYFRRTIREGLTGTDLKRIQVTSLAHQIERFLRDGGKELTDPPPAAVRGLRARTRPATRRQSQQGRKLPDDYWASLSEDYLEVRLWHSATPIVELERRYRENKRPDARRSLLSSRVNSAHEKGWLVRTGKGPRGTGSQPGPRLKAHRKALERRSSKGEGQ